MAESWATSGLDLHLDLGGPRLRVGLETALRDAVRSGQLGRGTRLPSSRALARDLGIARNTVADAYGQLVAEGWLTALQGSGTRVADRSAGAEAGPSRATTEVSPVRYDLRPGSPDVSAFPRSAWLAAARRALNRAPYDALGYSDPRGLLELRLALAEYLARTRGVRATSDRIVVCCGFTQGLRLLCHVLLERGGTTLATEAYGHGLHREVAAATGLHLSALPVDGRGALIGELANEDAALLTPAHQYPIGVPLAPRRRTLAVDWAVKTGGLIIEDDYDGEFRYDRQPVGAMQALAPERIVYAGTASKTLAPGLRLAWLVLPARLMDETVASKSLGDRQNSAIDQLTLAEFIASGAYDKHVRHCRLIYRRRRDRLVAELRRRVPGVRITGVAAGLHAVVELPSGENEGEVIARAARRGLALDCLGSHSVVADPYRPALVVGYGTPPEHAFTAAVARLCAVLSTSGDR